MASTSVFVLFLSALFWDEPQLDPGAKPLVGVRGQLKSPQEEVREKSLPEGEGLDCANKSQA